MPIGSKKLLYILFSVTFLLLVAGVSGGYLLLQKQKAPASQTSSQPQIFVSEEVTSAEKKDLTSFFSIWKRAVDRKATFDELQQLALGGSGRFNNDPVLKIGDETLYGNDLNYYFLFYHFNDYISQQTLSNEDLNKVTDEIIKDSTILQEASRLNLIVLDKSYFNSTTKNYTLRNQKVTLAKEQLSDKLVEKISGEAVAIWFRNDVIPISSESGKLLAKQKMETLYSQLKNGTITMAQAGEIIKNDSEIGLKIDPAYKNNAYYTFANRERTNQPFVFDNLNKEAWSLGEGQLSPIITAVDEQDPLQEFLFIIIKINKRTNTEKNNDTQTVIDDMSKQISKKNL